MPTLAGAILRKVIQQDGVDLDGTHRTGSGRERWRGVRSARLPRPTFGSGVARRFDAAAVDDDMVADPRLGPVSIAVPSNYAADDGGCLKLDHDHDDGARPPDASSPPTTRNGRVHDGRPSSVSDPKRGLGARLHGAAFVELLEHLPTDRLNGKVAATVVVTIDHDRLRIRWAPPGSTRVTTCPQRRPDGWPVPPVSSRQSSPVARYRSTSDARDASSPKPNALPWRPPMNDAPSSTAIGPTRGD